MAVIDLLDSDPAPQPGDGGYISGRNYIEGWIITQVGEDRFQAPPGGYSLVREWETYPDSSIMVEGELTVPPPEFFTDDPFSAPEWHAVITFGVGGPDLDNGDAVVSFDYVITSPTNGERSRYYIAGGVLQDTEETDFDAGATFSEWSLSANDILQACGLETSSEILTMRSGFRILDASHVGTPTESGEADDAISRLPSLHANTAEPPPLPDEPPEEVGLGEPSSGRHPIGGL